MSDTDLQLLARYTRQHAEDAFAELVRRHLDLVFTAALRQVRSPQLAEEVAQSTFTDLARNAAKLTNATGGSLVLTAWLYQVTRRTAIDVVRRESRRQLREQIATDMNAMNAAADDWGQIEPLLDEAMHALDDTDRTAVLLRYFENKSLREVGETLGASEEAARKRISRAVERLREFFAKRGVTVGASGLVVVISANAVQAAPVGFAVTISTAAALAGTTIAASATATATKAIAMTTLQKTLVTATVALLAGAGIYEARQASNARAETETLRQQQSPLTEKVHQLTRERDEAKRQAAAQRDEIERLNRNPSELLKLRGEVGVLKRALASKEHQNSQQSNVSKSVSTESRPPGSVITRNQIGFAGYGTPESTWESWLWAEYFGTYEQTLECMTPEQRALVLRNTESRDTFESFKSTVGSNFNWMQIVAKKVLADDVVELKVKSLVGEREESSICQLRKVGGEWKLSGGSYPYEATWGSNGQIQTFVP